MKYEKNYELELPRGYEPIKIFDTSSNKTTIFLNLAALIILIFVAGCGLLILLWLNKLSNIKVNFIYTIFFC